MPCRRDGGVRSCPSDAVREPHELSRPPPRAHPADRPEVSRASSGEQPSKDLVVLCKADLKKTLPACEIDGKAALLDDKGRFTPESRPCYFALAEALHNTARIATTGLGCCRCAIAQGCTPNAATCLRSLGDDPPILPECAPSTCYDACSHMIPRSGPAKATARPRGDAALEPQQQPRYQRRTYVVPPQQSPSPYPVDPTPYPYGP